MGLLEDFLVLPQPAEAASFSVVADRGQPCRAARSVAGHPAVLIAFTRETGQSAPRDLATIRYQPPTPVEVVDGEQRRTTRLAVLECKTVDPLLASYFFRVMNMILADLKRFDENELEAALDAIITLFRALQRPAQHSVQGLWAELAMITWAHQPEIALASWHSEPNALHDFAAGALRLEIKSTVKPLREHVFLLDQLSTLSPGVTLIASIILLESSSGSNLGDLVDRIRTRLPRGYEYGLRLEVIVAETLGQSWHDAQEIRFDLEAASRSLRLYRAEDIPSVAQPLPPEVRQVHFIADLSGTPNLPIDDARRIDDLFGQLLPA